CRYEKIRSTKIHDKKNAKIFLACVLTTAILISTISVNRFLKVIPSAFDEIVVSTPAGGQPRDVDLQRIHKLIQQKKLSDKESQFYKKVDSKQIQPEEGKH
ncbi:MAG: hypothetical protein ACYS80_15510, partial [Planctomycetota bacterium]